MMKHVTAAALLAAAPWLAFAQPLLSATELQTQLPNTDLRIVDIRDGESYASGHLPGAVSAPYAQWRGPADNPGALPPLTTLADRVRTLGLDENSHAVIVSHGDSDTDFGAAARVYWTLKVLGLTDLSILNGGVKAWQQAGLPLDTQTVVVKASDFEPQFNESLLIERDEIAHLADHNTRALLVDARPKDFFDGKASHPAAKVAGTLDGAQNVPHNLWFDASGTEIAPVASLQQIADQYALVQPNQDVETVSFCNTGHWAATNWFVLSELLEQPNVKLYAGSMVDWTQADEALPVMNAPGRIEQLWRNAQQWLSN